MKTTLSVIVITKNEERDLERCLRSVWFADEIVVLDSGSTDSTVEIANRFTDRVYVNKDWPGFGKQKNRALEYASSEWVLSLDADEWVTEALANEIRSTIQESSFSAYQIPRLSSFCGKPIRHSGWYPDFVLRLFKKPVARFSEDLVHERVITEEVTGSLEHPIRHASYRNLNEVMDKTVRYAKDGAKNRFLQGRKTNLTKTLLSTFWAFFRTWILRLGILDGRAGFFIAVANAEGTYYRNLRLMEILQKKDEVSVALVVSTYNRPDALERVLVSIEALDELPDEILIADDGSGEETKSLLERWERRIPLKHIWQEDRGFRLASSRNNAVRNSVSDYIIFVDGDCVLPADFVSVHKKLSEKECFVSGSRVLLSKRMTQEALSKKISLEQCGFHCLLLRRLRGDVNRVSAIAKLPGQAWRRWRAAEWKKIRGSNMAFWREDLIAVNGFDEAFSSWGYEDSDLVVRLLRHGVRRKDGIYASYVMHLWHVEASRDDEAKMHRILEETLSGNRPIYAQAGLSTRG